MSTGLWYAIVDYPLSQAIENDTDIPQTNETLSNINNARTKCVVSFVSGYNFKHKNYAIFTTAQALLAFQEANASEWDEEKATHSPPETADHRQITVVNRIELGYTIYPTGVSDNITDGTYGNGQVLQMHKGNKTVDFQMLHHYYGIGGRAIWEDASVKDCIDADLIAPKTEGVQEAGDFIKVEVIPSSGMHVYVPSPSGAGTGNWNLDIDGHIDPKGCVLKCTPVPVPGNTGWFDYDSATNTLEVNEEQKGGYNLYDFDVKLFAFGRKLWGRKDDGESVLESTDVIGKLLYNCWVIRFNLTIDDEENRDPTVGIIMTTATKKNI